VNYRGVPSGARCSGEGGHAGGRGVAVEHQGSRAHPGDSSAQPQAARVGLAMRAAARWPMDYDGGGYRWLRD
jgi:hypothetical protein